MRHRLSGLLAVLSAALLLSATPTPATAQTGAQAPVRAVYGGVISTDNPLRAIGSKIPSTFTAAVPPAMPSPPALNQQRENAAKILPTQPPPPASLQAAAAPPHSTPFVTVKYCRDTYGEEDGAMALDRYNWCAMRPSVVYYIDEDGQVQGTTTFRMVTAGRGDKGSRKAFFTSEFDRFQDSGVVLPAALVTLQLSYSTSGYSDTDGSNPACGVVGNSPATVANWRAGQAAVFEINSNKEDGYTPDKVSRCSVAQLGRSDLNAGWAQLQQTNIRADSSAYLGVTGAVIFSDKMPAMWDYSKSSPTHGEVARHIWDAQFQPGTTYPPKTGKTIPGSISSLRQLHRAANVVWDLEAYNRYRDNETAKNKACAALAPGGTPVGKQCDEYPFRSTMEGAGLGDGNFSVRYVSESHNNTAGQLLATWYQDERILNREGFFVAIGS
ncbi:NucA/NucB deoxyribonuclease domain-containing protein [Streptomyces lavendulae]|uniref:NucA/NucB deoxyribonuclease domain-containing protein n=3 Tax=Streptomyces lavendulae TaxID=1914 RepID=UPI00372106C0